MPHVLVLEMSAEIVAQTANQLMVPLKILVRIADTLGMFSLQPLGGALKFLARS